MVSNCCKISLIISAFVFSLFLISLINSAQSINVKNANLSFDHHRVESKRLKKIQDYLKEINKYAVKTIQSPDGDIVDCVPTHLQPAFVFDHPPEKGQKPKDPPDEFMLISNETWEEFQVWRMSGESCPENTIPIRRTTEKEALVRQSHACKRKSRDFDDMKGIDGFVHQNAVLNAYGEYYGASAYIQVWQPFVEGDDSSMSQIWIRAGDPYRPGDLNSIEVGLQVYPSAYNSKYKTLPRIFAFWTDNGYISGCYDYDCGGFVHRSDKIMLGGTVSPISKVGGPLFEIPFIVKKDTSKKDGDWWLYIKGVAVGYWPSTNFYYLGNKPADNVEMGGEVAFRARQPHTRTEMGSGHFPKDKYASAAAFRDVQVLDFNGQNINHKHMWKAYTPKEHKKCYSSDGLKWGSNFKTNYFLYGGSGGAADGC